MAQTRLFSDWKSARRWAIMPSSMSNLLGLCRPITEDSFVMMVRVIGLGTIGLTGIALGTNSYLRKVGVVGLLEVWLDWIQLGLAGVGGAALVGETLSRVSRMMIPPFKSSSSLNVSSLH